MKKKLIINKIGFCYPKFNGEFTAEFVKKRLSKNGKVLICYFDTHIKNYKYKLNLEAKGLSEIKAFCPEQSNINFADVELNTNWKCSFRNGVWISAQQVIIIE